MTLPSHPQSLTKPWDFNLVTFPQIYHLLYIPCYTKQVMNFSRSDNCRYLNSSSPCGQSYLLPSCLWLPCSQNDLLKSNFITSMTYLITTLYWFPTTCSYPGLSPYSPSSSHSTLSSTLYSVNSNTFQPHSPYKSCFLKLECVVLPNSSFFTVLLSINTSDHSSPFSRFS